MATTVACTHACLEKVRYVLAMSVTARIPHMEESIRLVGRLFNNTHTSAPIKLTCEPEGKRAGNLEIVSAIESRNRQGVWLKAEGRWVQ
jgi:hypothetical protein